MKKQRIEKSTSGITLIALIITIIVLLILAGISIATLTGENGVLTKANDAKTETRGASVQEARDLWKINQEADKHAENETAQTLEAVLNDLESQKLITPEERAIIEETGQITIGSRTIVFKDYVKVGDYVDYHPDEITTPYDKFGENYTGYANKEIGQDSDLQWRVLNINSNGTIDLISDKPTSEVVYFRGARGYNNGVAILNDYCKMMYSNVSKGADARSLNIEDIQDKMKVDEETGKKAYENYMTGWQTKVLYGDYYSYTSNKWYPLKWKEDNGMDGESEPKNPTSLDIVHYESDDDARTKEGGTSLRVTQTFWTLTSTMSSNFETADARDATKKDSIYYELLCKKGNSDYWLASRYVNANISSYAGFGLRYVSSSGYTYGQDLLQSNSTNASKNCAICPIVTLKYDAIDVSTNYSAEGKWGLR